MIHKILAVIAAAAVAGGIAYAGSSNTNYTSAGTVGFRTTTDGTTNCVGTTACNLANVTIWDSAAGANGLAINASGQIAISNFPATTTLGAGAAAIGTVNPTTPASWGVGATGSAVPANGELMMASNAGTAVALQGDATNGLWVNIKAGAGSGGSSQTDNTAFTAGTTSMTVMGCFDATTAMSATSAAAVACTTARSLHVLDDNSAAALGHLANIDTNTGAAIPTGSNIIGKVGIDQTTPGTTNGVVINAGTNNIGSVTPALQTTNGLTPVRLSALSTTVTAIKAAGAGQLMMIQCYNPNAAAQAYVQIFATTTGTVTLGTTTPVLSIAIAPASTGGFTLSMVGMQIGSGGTPAITTAATTTAAGSTALGTPVDCNAAYN